MLAGVMLAVAVAFNSFAGLARGYLSSSGKDPGHAAHLGKFV
jgi:hypothetical protein